MLANIKAWLIAVGAAIAVLIGAYLKGRADNKAADTNDRLKAVNKARKIEDETSRLSDSDVDGAIDKWLRD